MRAPRLFCADSGLDGPGAVAVTVTGGACADDLNPLPVMAAGLEAAELSGKPLLVGTRRRTQDEKSAVETNAPDGR